MATWSRSAGVLGTVVVVLCWLAGTGGASASAAKAHPQVYFIAGVTDAVEVMLDGKPVASLSAKEIHGPVRVASGEHLVEFSADDWRTEARVPLSGSSLDVVVHRPADPGGDPIITVFPNDVSPIAADRARLTVAHTAVVPPADVRVSGKVLFANIANGEFVTTVVPADTYSVDIVPTGGSKPLFGPVDLTVTAGALNRVFAIGQPENGGMDAVVQVLPLRTTTVHPPTNVHAGSAGLVASTRTTNRTTNRTPTQGQSASAYPMLPVAGLAGLAGLVLAVTSIGLVRLQRRRHGT